MEPALSPYPPAPPFSPYGMAMESALSPTPPFSPRVSATPTPPPPSQNSLSQDLDWAEFFTVVGDLLTLACYGWFVFLIVLDVWRAIRKRATWLPGNAFSLSGVTVQIIFWWTSVSRIINECKKDVDVNDFIILHQLVLSGKVAVCVFIGYLLPGMAAPSLRTFLALGITICAQLASELRFFQVKNAMINKDYEAWRTWGKIANPVLLICIVVLASISICTILTSKTVHSLLKQRISAMFSISEKDEFQISNKRTMPDFWNDFEDKVLRSWLVARACQADYMISRSVLSSAVGVVVTVCVIIFLLSNTCRNKYFVKPFYAMDYAILSLLFSFIMIGWSVICWRWFAAQLYFRSHRQSWIRCLSLEDFWTRSTVELLHMYDLKRERQKFPNMQRLLTKVFIKLRLHKLPYLMLLFQRSVVIFSKLCGLLSEVIIGKYAYWLRKCMTKGQQLTENYERTLKVLCVLGEDPSDLWEANEKAFNKAKLLMQKGCEKGRSIKEKNSFVHLDSLQSGENETQLLNMLKTKAIPSILKYFPSVEKRCVRITAVSLIIIFIRLHKAKSGAMEKVLKVCHEIWDLLSFVDECDIDLQANGISLFDDLNKDKDHVYMAAERELYKLQMEYDKLDPSPVEPATNVQEARNILGALSSDCKQLLENEKLLGGEEVAANLSDSKDWVKIALHYNLYKLCEIMLEDDEIPNFVAWTEDALKNVIAFSLSRLPDLLVKQCWKWAGEFEEDKIWEAIDLAGKCRGIMEGWTIQGM